MRFWLIACLLGCLLSSCSDQSAQQLSSNTFSAEIKQLFLVTSVSPLHAKPGTEITVRGAGFTKDMILRIDSEIITPLSPPAFDSVSFLLPERSAGIVALVAHQDDEEARVPFVVEPTGDTPLFLGSSSIFCKGSSFLNASGATDVGLRDCRTSIFDGDSFYNCTKEGDLGCIATEQYPSVEKSTLADKVLQGYSVAGVAGTIADTVCPVVPPAIAINDVDFKLVANKENVANVVVGGSCSHLKAGIQLSLGDEIVGSGECIKKGNEYGWQLTFDASDFAEGELALKAKFVLLGLDAVTDQKILYKDTLPAGDVSLVSSPPSSSALTEIRTLIQSADLQSYQFAFTEADISCMDVTYGAWYPAAAELVLSLGADGDKTLCLRGRDANGNIQDAATRIFWEKDSQPPTAVLFSGVPIKPTLSSTVTISLSGDDVGFYKYSIVEGGPDCSGVTYSDWIQIDTAIMKSTPTDGLFRLCVIGRDSAGNIQTTASTTTWRRHTDVPSPVTLGDLPDSFSSATALNVTVSGTGITSYKYAKVADTTCESAVYGNWLPVANKITGGIGIDDVYRLCVVGRDQYDLPQLTPTEYGWIKDTVPLPDVTIFPLVPAESNLSALNVDVLATGLYSFSFDILVGVVSCSGAAYDVWKPSNEKLQEALGSDGSYTLCIVGRDRALNEQTTPTRYTWNKDTLNPANVTADAPSGRSNSSAVDITVTGSDVVSYKYSLSSAAADPGSPCAGVSYSSFTSINVHISESLSSEGDYHLCIIGRDAAKNEQTTPSYFQWIRDTLPPAAVTIGALPTNPSIDLALNVKVDGIDIDSYKYSLGTGSDCALRLYSEWFPISESIDDNLGADGTYTLCVLGRDIAGNVQTTPTKYSWVKRTVFHVKVTGENIFHSKVVVGLTVGSDSYNFDLTKGTANFQTSEEYEAGTHASVNIVSSLVDPALPCTLTQNNYVVGTVDLEIIIRCPAIDSISIFSNSTSVAAGTNRQIYATGHFAGGNFADITSIATWTSSAPVKATVISGLVYGVQSGSVSIKAELGGREETLPMQVFLKTIQSLTVSPAAVSHPIGSTKAFKAVATWNDGEVQDVTTSCSWSSNATAVATVNNASSRGLVSTVSAGVATISATFGVQTASADLTVTNVTLNSLEISPAILTGAIGLKQQFAATGIYSDGSSQDLTNQVVWSIPSPEIASVTPSGKAELLKSGVTSIVATMGALNASRGIIVSAATLESISISPTPSLSIAAGYSKQLTATAHYSDWTSKNVTDQVQWSVSDPSYAGVGNNVGSQGLLQALASGSTTVTASLENKIASLALTVTSAILTSISVSPKTYLVSRDGTLQYSALGTFSDNSTIDITDQVFWSTSHAKTLISNSQGSKGFFANTYTGTAYPSFTVTATMSGISNTASGVLTAGTLLGLKMNPVTAKINRANPISFKVYGIYSDGASFDLTNLAVFSTSNPAVGLVSNSAGDRGLFTAIEEGATDVRVDFSSFNAVSSVEIDDEFDPSASNQGVGLTAKYYAFDWISPGGDFVTQVSTIKESNLKGTRIDSSVNFNWLTGAAPLGIVDDFAVRWTGRVYFPVADMTYHIRTRSDDGVRLWIDNVLVIDQWSDHSETAHLYDLSVSQAGYKSVKIEFYEHGANAVMKFEWKHSGMSGYVPVPTTYLFPE